MSEQISPAETHDQFLLRAARVFPPDQAQEWSRLERAVFNALMARQVHSRGYAAISDEMLWSIRENMQKLVRICSTGGQ